MNNEFSVLMSLYNGEKSSYLDECFESLSFQTLTPTEIVLVIDGPIRNELRKVIIDWSSILPIKLFELRENQGLGKALNFGLSQCCYDLVFRMDTDDICRKTRFEKQINYFNNNPDVVILGTLIEEFDHKPGDLKKIRTVPTTIGDSIKFRNPLNHMTVAYKKSSILEVGGYKHLDLMEDYYLWLRCFKKGYNMKNLQSIEVDARVGNGMLKRRSGIRYLKSELTLAKRKIKLFGLPSAKESIFMFIRILSRVAPGKILEYIYQSTRKIL